MKDEGEAAIRIGNNGGWRSKVGREDMKGKAKTKQRKEETQDKYQCVKEEAQRRREVCDTEGEKGKRRSILGVILGKQ